MSESESGASAATRGITPFVLAAGFASRLRPLTDDRAKAVIPFLNRPLLDYTLDWLSRCGFRRVVINLHHAPETIAGRYGSRAFDLDIEYSRESRILGTGGGLRRVLDRLGDDVLVVNGDVLTLAALGPLVRHHLDSGAMATLGLYSGATGRDYPQVLADGAGRLVGFPGDRAAGSAVVSGAAPVRGVFCGLHLVRREALELLPEGRFAGIVDHLYRPLLEQGFELGALPLAGAWYEIGEPGRYIDHQLEALRCGSAPLALARVPRSMDAGYLALDGHVETTRLRPPFLIGSGARVRDGARVEGSVLADLVRVAEGARVTECVLWRGSAVGPGARLRRCVVMEDVRVPSGTVAEERVFTPEGGLEFGRPRARAG